MGIHDKREQGLYNFGSLDGICPRLYDRPDVALFQYTWGQSEGQIRDKSKGIKKSKAERAEE
jgi:hypothetical protein